MNIRYCLWFCGEEYANGGLILGELCDEGQDRLILGELCDEGQDVGVSIVEYLSAGVGALELCGVHVHSVTIIQCGRIVLQLYSAGRVDVPAPLHR
jgi:hypothetical protein